MFKKLNLFYNKEKFKKNLLDNRGVVLSYQMLYSDFLNYQALNKDNSLQVKIIKGNFIKYQSLTNDIFLYKKKIKAGRFLTFSVNDFATVLSLLNATSFKGHTSIFFFSRRFNTVYDLKKNSVKKLKVVYNPSNIYEPLINVLDSSLIWFVRSI